MIFPPKILTIIDLVGPSAPAHHLHTRPYAPRFPPKYTCFFSIPLLSPAFLCFIFFLLPGPTNAVVSRRSRCYYYYHPDICVCVSAHVGINRWCFYPTAVPTTTRTAYVHTHTQTTIIIKPCCFSPYEWHDVFIYVYNIHVYKWRAVSSATGYEESLYHIYL